MNLPDIKGFRTTYTSLYKYQSIEISILASADIEMEAADPQAGALEEDLLCDLLAQTQENP